MKASRLLSILAVIALFFACYVQLQLIETKKIGIRFTAGSLYPQGEKLDETQVDFLSEELLKQRRDKFDSWFDRNGTKKLFPNADANGTIMDFAIVGFPKCGTSTMEGNLGHIAPMPLADVCTPVSNTVYYAYKNWPEQYGDDKLLRGTKCPMFLDFDGGWLDEWSYHLPRTKLIVGIRHPVLWFQSFWNMARSNGFTGFAGDDPYKITKPCQKGKHCSHGCPHRRPHFCLHRARFHLALASLGKTPLTPEERHLLAPHDIDGGDDVRSHDIKNDIFLYEQRELSEEYVWEDLARYLSVPNITHDEYHGSHGRNPKRAADLCEEKYDGLRAMLLPYSYELSRWLREYLLPVARNGSRTDVVIPRADAFGDLVKDYELDPCGRLARLENGTYAVLDNSTMIGRR